MALKGWGFDCAEYILGFIITATDCIRAKRSNDSINKQINNMTNTFLNFSILDKSAFPLSWNLLLYLTRRIVVTKKSTLMVPWCLCGTTMFKCSKYYGTFVLCSLQTLIWWYGMIILLYFKHTMVLLRYVLALNTSWGHS